MIAVLYMWLQHHENLNKVFDNVQVWCSGGHSYVKRDGLVQWWASLRQKMMACCSVGHCFFNKGWSVAGMGIVTSKKDGLVQWWA